jgi:hypothetical protein
MCPLSRRRASRARGQEGRTLGVRRSSPVAAPAAIWTPPVPGRILRPPGGSRTMQTPRNTAYMRIAVLLVVVAALLVVIF